MNQKNALEIFRQRAEKNPRLKAAFIEEKRKYQIACKIRECRRRNNLTQKKLAALIGSKQSVISRLENAEYTGHSLNVLTKISEVMNEPLESFLTEEIQEPETLKFHIPKVLNKYKSFYGWNPSQILSTRPHA